MSRRELSRLLGEIADKYPPGREIDLPSLADGFMSAFEGAFILSKSFDQPEITAQQLHHYKTYVELLFRRDLQPR